MHLRTRLASLDRKPATIEAYERVGHSHLVPPVDRLRMQHLTPPQINAAYRALQADKGLSPTTVHPVHRVLSKALSDAVDDGLLAANPAPRTQCSVDLDR